LCDSARKGKVEHVKMLLVKLDIPMIFLHSKFPFGKSGLLHVHVNDGGAVQQLARHA